MKTILLFSLLTCSIALSAQTILTMPDGKTVQLNQNGTWIYKENKDSAVYVSPKKYYHFSYGINSWTQQSIENSMWDAEFKSRNGVIKATVKEFEKFFTREKIQDLVRDEYKDKGTIKNFDVEERSLNGVPVNYYKVRLNVTGDNFMYTGIIISNANGSFQMSVGGQEELFKLNKEAVEDLLFSVQKN